MLDRRIPSVGCRRAAGRRLRRGGYAVQREPGISPGLRSMSTTSSTNGQHPYLLPPIPQCSEADWEPIAGKLSSLCTNVYF